MRRYVLGFAFDGNGRCVLIDRNKDDWQRGRINGLGGSIEDGETVVSAMVREFREECGVETTPSDWRYILTIHDPGWEIAVFKGKIDASVTLLNCEEGDVFWAESPPSRMDPTALWLYWLCQDDAKFRISTQISVFHNVMKVGGMFEKVRYHAKRKMLGEHIVAEVDGVTAVLVTFVLEDGDKKAHGCRVFKGDFHNGPYRSIATDLYFDQNGALLETVDIARSLGVSQVDWLAAIGITLTTG